MRETIAAVAIAGLLGVACEGKMNASAPAGSPAAPPAAVASKPAAAPAENAKPARKVRKPVRIAKASKAASTADKKGRETVAGEPRAPAIELKQSPPSSY